MPEKILVKVNPRDINCLNHILEGYENLGVLTTTDSKQGLAMIRVTPDTYQDVVDILKTAPVEVEIV